MRTAAYILTVITLFSSYTFAQRPGDEVDMQACVDADLHCKNDATCRYLGSDIDHDNEGNTLVPYCDCSEGWGGITCELEQVRCPNSNVYCYNGSQCKSSGNEESWSCECPTPTMENIFIGASCEHKADICRGDRSLSEILEEGAYCSQNGGRCIDGENGSFLHCNCDYGYEGDHCEYTLGEAPGSGTATATDESDEGGSKSLSSVEAFFLSIFIISSVVVAAYYGRKLIKKKAVEAKVMNDLKLSHEENNASVTVVDNEDKEIV